MQRISTYAVSGVFGLLLLFVLWTHHSPSSVASADNAQAGDYLFCHWNVENLFDDQDNGRTANGDKEYDGLFANNPELLKQKLKKLADAIMKMNDRKGPDILALVEVESVRAAELLQKTLNDRITDPSLRYHNLLMKEISAGRHIAPAILTRLPVVRDRTRVHGSRQRILEGRIVVNRHELILFASHWTSRLKDGEKGRHDYADKIYGAANAIFRSNRSADFLVAGDFNDDPGDDSVVNNLHAIGDKRIVQTSDSLKLFNLMADKNAVNYGTHYYKKWHIFDQIAVSPGMLDGKGWSCDPNSVRVMNELHKANDKQKRPWRFGGAKEKGERGYSDHFPVTVRLHVER